MTTLTQTLETMHALLHEARTKVQEHDRLTQVISECDAEISQLKRDIRDLGHVCKANQSLMRQVDDLILQRKIARNALRST